MASACDDPEGQSSEEFFYTPQVDVKYTPCLAKEFESEETSYQFYNEYGKLGGFSIKRHHHSKSIDGVMINRKFVCCKQGVREERNGENNVKNHKRETRCNCLASMSIRLDRKTSRWVIKEFQVCHIHKLHIPEVVHMMPSQRRLTAAQAENAILAAKSGLSLKASIDLMSTQVGGRQNLGFTSEDLKWYLRSNRQRDLEYGGAGCLMTYFQEKVSKDPFFFFAIQRDVKELVTNIFWADHQMILDYGHFGDAVTFDTTFRTNKEYRHFACFVGFNHFRQTVIFGAALLYDETSASFEWLFQTFIRAMSGKKPVTIFTDQDPAMAKALRDVMPDVRHSLCTWHLMQNAIKHFGYLCKDRSAFLRDLKACVYGYENEDELIKGWEKLLVEFNLEGHPWMSKTWEIREKWAHVYMKWTFSAGI